MCVGSNPTKGTKLSNAFVAQMVEAAVLETVYVSVRIRPKVPN